MEIHEENVVNIDLPPLVWFEYSKTPKILSATNTGRTILINGQWACGRPYITGGPLNGSYIFSQIHFHSPSEHEIDGRRYPLEMHVVHYKNSYLTQERAMKEKDGTIVLVYLFQLIECGGTIVSHISKLASSLEEKNARRELSKIPLDQFVKPFNSNYYTYQSSVPTDKSSYLLQWIISCNNLCVTRQEIDELRFIMNSNYSIGYMATMQPENDVVFRVGEEDYCEWMSSSPTTENPCCQQKKVCSRTSACKKDSEASICGKDSEASVCNKCSKTSVCKKCSKTSTCRKCSKASTCKRCSKTSVCKKTSKGTVCKKISKTSVSGKCSKKSVREKSSRTFVTKKSSKKSVNKKSSKTTVNEKTSQKSIDKKSSKTSGDGKSSKTSVHEKSSRTSINSKSSKTSVSEKSSETSCNSVKGKKKKRSKSKSVKVCDTADTTPSCSKSDVNEKKQKAKKSKDVCVTKSKSVKKCKDQDGTSETSVKNATACTSKESAGEKKSKKKSAGSKSSKTKVKNSGGSEKEKCVESHASKSTEKSDCLEANVKAQEKSTEKVKILYEKKGNAQVDPSACNRESSKADEIIESANICDDVENDDDPCEDVRINYLFIPNTSSSVPSNVGNVESNAIEAKNEKSLTKTENATTGSKDFFKLPSQSIISHALVNAIKFPVVKSGQTKNLYLHTKHIFRTEGNNREFTPHSFQECHILIERDHNVLQEYNGTLCPSQLSLGNYEQLNLSPRYSDPDDLKIHATECIAKLESLHELSIRAKFIISETNLNGRKSETFLANKKSKDSNEDMKSSYDAQCQCEHPVSTSIALDTKFLEREGTSSCKSLIKWDLRNMGVESLDFKNTDIVNMQSLNLRIGNESDSSRSIEETNSKKTLVEQNDLLKLLKNLNASEPGSETTLTNLLEQIDVRDDGKGIDDKISIKSTRNSLGKHKKTTYFVYDRIEKDESSGKKIFIGNFRSRDEIKVLYKPEYLPQSDRISSDLSDTQSNNNRSLTGGNESRENVTEKFMRDSQANKESASKQDEPTKKGESKKSDHKKEVITLHKFEPKHNNLRAARKKSRNHIVGKISSKVDTESEKYSQLVNMLGVDKTRLPKISFYEFQESDSQNLNNISSENSSKFDVITLKAVENSEEVGKDNVFPSTSNRTDSPDGEYNEGLEGTSSLKKGSKSSDSEDSQAAVIVLPIEVDSLSKVEIVLIEHTDDVKKRKGENKYTSYLKHYKRLILKLKSSFL